MDADSAQVADDDAIIASYFGRVRKAARHLPSGRRDWVIAQAGHRLADALAADSEDRPGEDPPGENRPGEDPPGEDRPSASAAMARLGDPAGLVCAIDGHVPGAEARWMEFAAVLLVLAGGILWRPAWLIGVTLLWVSPRWRWPDKLLATVVWPGGLLVASLLVSRYTLPGLFMRGGFAQHSFGVNGASGGSFFVRTHGSFRYLVDSTLGHPPLRHLLALLGAAVPPVVVAIRLLRRARRPEQPQTAALTAPDVTGQAAPGVTGQAAATDPS